MDYNLKATESYLKFFDENFEINLPFLYNKKILNRTEFYMNKITKIISLEIQNNNINKEVFNQYENLIEENHEIYIKMKSLSFKNGVLKDKLYKLKKSQIEIFFKNKDYTIINILITK
ncbi:hypothetical protein [Cetobacterium sp. SF1]|uniref:hypothetical protein n=1 Tax=Cetobacterium sp. SF1 TaxID=3417654 RepID=UPI003CE929E5